jgi:acyl-CoA thioester hydrolase
MPNLLSNYPVVIEQPVAWGDLDLHGHVNNIWFFRYIENARIAYYERIRKYDHERQTGISFVLAATSCSFKTPLTYPATILVGARVDEIKADRMMMRYRLVNPDGHQISAEASATLVCFDYHQNRKAPFPRTLHRRIVDLQKDAEI